MHGLAARILALALGLVAVTALAAGLATVGSAVASARAEQRTELQAQASLVTLQSARLVTPKGLQRVKGRLDGTVLTVWSDAGAVLLSSAPRRRGLERLTAADARRAIAGGTVSTGLRLHGREVLVEARPTADGGAVVLTRPTTAFTAATGALVGRILAVVAAVLVLAAVAAVWLARRIARPLRATAAAAKRLEHGERGVAVPRGGPAEVREVADALRALDGALTTSEGRQREFLLSVSHELRTPLTALRGYAEAMADGLITGDRVAETGRTLTAETVRLERFTADLLELARLQADDFPLTVEDVDLAAVAATAAIAWRARAEALDVALRVEASPTVARGDAQRVRQVLDGLVENALRATPAGGVVTIAVEEEAGGAAAAVEDTGPGLSDEDLAAAFTRGLLRERYRETRAVGTGLGLSIATRLAGRMGGSVTAEHARTPPGARFVLRLPVPRVGLDPASRRSGAGEDGVSADPA